LGLLKKEKSSSSEYGSKKKVSVSPQKGQLWNIEKRGVQKKNAQPAPLKKGGDRCRKKKKDFDQRKKGSVSLGEEGTEGAPERKGPGCSAN